MVKFDCSQHGSIVTLHKLRRHQDSKQICAFYTCVLLLFFPS